MDRRISVISALLILLALFSAGCLANAGATKLYCCDAKIAAEKGYCYVSTKINDVDVIKDYKSKTISCNSAEKPNICVVTESTGELEIPICDGEKEASCISGSCKAMVCGPFSFIPNPIDDVDSQTIYGDSGGIASGNNPATLSSFSLDNFGGSSNQGLLNGMCRFLPVDSYFQYAFDNTKGVYLNTFRFGVGETVEQYERAKLYFPTSDYFCSAIHENENDPRFLNVDRYLNYLVDEDDYNSYLNWFKTVTELHGFSADIYKPAEKGLPSGFFDVYSNPEACAMSKPKSQLGDTGFNFNVFDFSGPYDGHQYINRFGNYITNDQEYSPSPDKFLSEGGQKLDSSSDLIKNCGGMEKIATAALDHPLTKSDINCGGGPVGSTLEDVLEKALAGVTINFVDYQYLVKDVSPVYRAGTRPDKEFYNKTLRFLYFGYEKLNNARAPFECSNGGECLSGTCSTDSYKRFVCVREEDGGKESYVECLCTEGFDDRDKVMEYSIRCRGNPEPEITALDVVDPDNNYHYVSFLGDVDLGRATMETYKISYEPKLASNFNGDEWAIENNPNLETHAPSNMNIDNERNFGDIVFPFNTMSYKSKSGATVSVLGYSFLTPSDFAKSALVTSCDMKAGVDYSYDTFASSSEAEQYYAPLVESVPGFFGYTKIAGVSIYSQNFIYIRSLGKCKQNTEGAVKNGPEILKFGWCEPCTYSTLSYEHGLGYMQGGDADAIEANKTYLAYNLQRQLASSTIPTLDLSNDAVWEDVFVDDGGGAYHINENSAVKGWISNRGPITVVIGNPASALDCGTKVACKSKELYQRAEYVHSVCNKCLTALLMDNLDPAVSSWKTFDWNKAIAFTSGYFNGATSSSSCYVNGKSVCDSDYLNSVDLLLFHYVPSDRTDSNPGWCTDDNSQYEHIMADLELLGQTTLSYYQKPSLILFTIKNNDPNDIHTSECWARHTTGDEGITSDVNTLEGLMRYLFVNQARLTKAGFSGLIYPSYDDYGLKFTSKSDDYVLVNAFPTDNDGTTPIYYDSKGEKFCAFNKGANFINGEKFVYYYQKQYLADSAECIEKDAQQKLREEADPTNPQWDTMTKCLNNVECTLPQGVPVSDKTNYMCPQNTLVGSCTLCKDMGSAQVDCVSTDQYGADEASSYSVSQFSSDIWLDLIGSLPSEYVCCLEDSNGKYTYVKSGGSTPNKSPIVFSTSGNKDEDCGIYTSDAMGSTASCTSESPIKYNKLACVKK